MKKKVYIIEQTAYFSIGEITEGIETEQGLVVKQHLIPKEQYVVLNEKLTKADEEKVRGIVREILKKMLWRLYTRSAFFTK